MGGGQGPTGSSRDGELSEAVELQQLRRRVIDPAVSIAVLVSTHLG